MGALHDVGAACFAYGFMMCGLFLLVPFKLSKKFHEAFFARFCFPLAIHVMRGRMGEIRRQAVSQLNSLVSHDPTLKKEGAIRVLEIGAGFGANFEHMKRKVKYWNLDPNAEFDDGFRKNLKKNPNVEMERWIHAHAEDMRGVPDAHFDVVLMTYVLCSVTGMEKVIAECKRVLSKGGRVVFMEHVAHPKGTWGFLVQTLLDPLWSFTFCGCHINRRPGDLFEKAGFGPVQITEVYLSMPTIMSPHVYGFALLGEV